MNNLILFKYFIYFRIREYQVGVEDNVIAAMPMRQKIKISPSQKIEIPPKNEEKPTTHSTDWFFIVLICLPASIPICAFVIFLIVMISRCVNNLQRMCSNQELLHL